MEHRLEGVEIVVIASDGTDGGKILSPEEFTLLSAVRAALEGHEDFLAHYPGAKLVRVDSNQGEKMTSKGRLYLRYAQEGKAPSEWWGCYGKHPKIDFHSGVVMVLEQITPDT